MADASSTASPSVGTSKGPSPAGAENRGETKVDGEVPTLGHLGQGAGDKDPLYYSQQTIESLQPIRLLMIICGRSSFRLKMNVLDRYEFVYEKNHPRNIISLFITGLIGVQGLLLLVNIFSFLSDAPTYNRNDVPDYYKLGKGNGTGFIDAKALRAEEQYIFRRNLSSLIVICCYLFQGLYASYIFFSRREFITYFFSFILEAAEMTKINLGYGTKGFMWLFVGFWFGGFLCLIVFSVSLTYWMEHNKDSFAPMSTGACSVMTTMSYRIFYPPIHAIPHTLFLVLRTFHGLITVLIIINVNVHIMMFVWCCRAIGNGFLTWNGRVDAVLRKDEQNRSNQEREIHRTMLYQMFTDHVVLLDLIQGVDRVFAGIIETYIFAQIVCFGFGLYFMLRNILGLDRATSISEFERAREMDSLIVVFFTILSGTVQYYCLRAPADISDEALEGLEVIRRRGFMGKKSDEELYFILSMYVSYTGHYEIAIVCGNYFTMDNTLFITFLGSICVFFVLMCQLSIPLTLNSKQAENTLLKFNRLKPINTVLYQTEGTFFG